MLHRLRTTLTLIGVIIGIGSIIFLVSLGFGLERLVTKQITSATTFQILDVLSNSKLLKLNNESIQKIKEIPGVEDVQPFVQIPAKIKIGENSTETIIYGATKEYLKLAEVRVSKGKEINDKNQILITTSLFSLLGRSEKELLGKEVSLEFALSSDLTDKEGSKKEDKFILVGFAKDDENSLIYLSADYLKEINVVNFTGAKVVVSDKKAVSSVRKYIEGLGFKVYYIGDTLAQVKQFFDVFRILLSLFGIIVLIVACVGMFNTLTISLLERTREIGLMKALGLRKKDINRLFLCEALFLGFVGGVFGIIVGFLTTKLINLILNIIAQRVGAEPQTVFSTPFWFVIIILGFSIFAALLVGIYPARRAVKVNPLDALRYE